MSFPVPAKPETVVKPVPVVRFHTVKAVKRGTVRLPAAKAKPRKQSQVRHTARVVRHGARRPKATPSYYIRTPLPSVMYAKGCRAGENRSFGIIILAFGKPYYNGHSYGTMTFNLRFSSNRDITEGMKSFTRGYVSCLPKGSKAHIVLARGTSNYFTWIPSHYQAGRKWARETVVFARWLRENHLEDRVSSASAIDAEPAWNPSFTRTFDFFRGYRDYKPGYLLYNYGSLDGGVGAIWDARQIFFVSGGMKYARMIPEIYYPSMADQWAEMARIAIERYGRPVRFAGLMTQHKAQCGCGYRPKEAHRALVLALREHPKTWVRRMPAATNILWD